MKRNQQAIDASQSIPNYSIREQYAFLAGVSWADKTIIDKACEYAQSKYDLDYCGNVRDILNYLKSLVEG